jgi:hypothetical protein
MKQSVIIVLKVFFIAMNAVAADYVPEPKIVQTPYLIGAFYFPGWKEGTHYGWEKITPFPERKPLLGWYDEGSPEVADWEIKWCVEHGISFFVYCWYRSGENKPIQTYLGHAIHDGLFKAKFRDKFRFAIMWENANGKGVSSEDDLLINLFPYWMETYFKHPGYLKVDGKPVLFIYNLDKLVNNLGNADNVHAAFEKIRSMAISRGFKGMLILCENRSRDKAVLITIKRCGFDNMFAYCWSMKENDTSSGAAIQAQINNLTRWKDLSIVPFVPTISMGWDSKPWQPDNTQQWRIPPSDFTTLCKKAKKIMDHLPVQSLGRKMLLLDNWNEWGEGHFIAPSTQNGFGYLDAVRHIFTTATEKHRDLVPADVGLGPYDSLFCKPKTPQ